MCGGFWECPTGSARLAASPPYPHSAEYNKKGQEKLAGYANPVHLGLRQREATILRLPRPDGDQVLIRSQPIGSIECQIPITVETNKGIRRPGRTANYHKATLRVLLAGVVGSCRSHQQGTPGVLWVAGVDCRSIQLRCSEARLGRAEEFLNAGFVSVLGFKRTGQG